MPETPVPAAPLPVRLSYPDLFVIFLKAGLAFGGGLGILSVLEDELVTRRGVISREDFLTYYGISRIVPSGSMTALAVAFGYRLGGGFGTVLALAALVIPALVITIVLTVLYEQFKNTDLQSWLSVSVLPAALAIIIAAAVKLGKDVFKPSPDLVLALAAFAAVFFFKANPALVLVAGGLLGLVIFRPRAGAAQ